MFRISGFTDEVSSDFDKQLALAQKLGMKYICPRNVNKRGIAQYGLDEFERELLPKMQRAGIGFSSIGSPIGKAKWDDDAAFAKQKEQLAMLIGIAEKAGCRYIRVFSFYVKPGFDEDAVYPAVLAKTRELVALAEGHDVVLMHENEKGIYGDLPERALKLHQDVAHPQYQLCYDASNYIQCGADPYAAYEQTKPYTVYYHMKDCIDGVEVPLGTGQGRIQDILDDLVKSGYDGFVTMEPHTALYALLRKVLYALPFLSKKRPAVYHGIDAGRGLTAKDKVTRAQVFDWQYENLTDMIKQAGGRYE